MPGQVASHTPEFGHIDRGADLRINFLEVTAELAAQLRQIAVSVKESIHRLHWAAPPRAVPKFRHCITPWIRRRPVRVNPWLGGPGGR
eukprot:scaffold13031_cov101-Isochrysis_galbana.AAC.5